MKNTIFTIILISLMSGAYGQRKIAFYASIQGTWDKTKNTQKAQFGGNNKLLHNHFGSYSKELRTYIVETNSTAEISFHLNTLGEVDSIYFVKPMTNYNANRLIAEIIDATSKKWRVGQKDGVKLEEWIKIWVHIYASDLNKKTLEENISDGQTYFNEGKFSKSLKATNAALVYDQLNVSATILKCKILLAQDSKLEACELLNSFAKYQNEQITAMMYEECQ